MTDLSSASGRSPTLDLLRRATRCVHERLEARVDAIERLADPSRRAGLVARYAALHGPAEAALGASLRAVPDLDFTARGRPGLGDAPPDAPAFPRPATRAEALGILYVLEGSTLGGRMILRELERRGIRDGALRFLDPYGPETGRRWRGFLEVLERETADASAREDAARGAARGFAHAETVLCEAAP